MLRKDFPGGRLLCLRRRRSRLPWIYLVYQEGLKGIGARGKGFAPYPLALTPDANPAASSLRGGETRGRRRPRPRQGRHLPHRPQAAATRPSFLRSGRAPAAVKRPADPAQASLFFPSNEPSSAAGPPVSELQI